MSLEELLFIIFLWIVFLVVSFVLTRKAIQVYQTRLRLSHGVERLDKSRRKKVDTFERLRVWLVGGGFEAKNAVFIYLVSNLTSITLGFLCFFFLRNSSLISQGANSLLQLPGSAGDMFVPVINLAPYIIFLLIATLPWVYVRACREKRIESINQDLPIFLEFLVTLSEAGLGFDEAMSRLLEVYDEKRPIVYGFRGFQKSIMAGSARLQAFWQLRERLQTPTIRKFVSALIQSEQTGGRMSEILRYQAEDIINYRRMKALELASSLPVKLLFPMLVCFLPGIFIATLGPVFYQFIEVMDTVVRSMS